MIILHKESKEKILDFRDIKESTAHANVHGDSKKNQPWYSDSKYCLWSQTDLGFLALIFSCMQ